MKVFLVGPKYDRHQSNFPDFARTASYWRAQGHTVISSAELDVQDGAHAEDGWQVNLSEQYRNDLFRRDVTELVKCDCVVLLEGWDESTECELMADIAYHCDMEAFENVGEDNFYKDLSGEDPETEEEEYDYFTPEGDRVGLDTRFSDVVRQMEELHYKKQKDYGRTEDPFANVRASEDFGIPGWVGSVVRGNDKMKRLQKFAQGDKLVNESVEDSFLDLAVYMIIGLILFREANPD